MNEHTREILKRELAEIERAYFEGTSEIGKLAFPEDAEYETTGEIEQETDTWRSFS